MNGWLEKGRMVNGWLEKGRVVNTEQLVNKIKCGDSVVRIECG